MPSKKIVFENFQKEYFRNFCYNKILTSYFDEKLFLNDGTFPQLAAYKEVFRPAGTCP